MTEFEQEVESVLGQFCFAFGAGAANARIAHRTIRALQSRYRPYISANFKSDAGLQAWDEPERGFGVHTLAFMC